MGAVYIKKDQIKDIQVINMDSFCLPQLVLARVLRILIRDGARVFIDSTWVLNLKLKDDEFWNRCG